MVLRIGFNPTRSTSPCYNNYTVIQKIHTFTYIHKNESKYSEMGPVRQNPIQRPVSLLVCSYVCALHCAHTMTNSSRLSGVCYCACQLTWTRKHHSCSSWNASGNLKMSWTDSSACVRNWTCSCLPTNSHSVRSDSVLVGVVLVSHVLHTHTHTHNCFTALLSGPPG